jgi:elongation factor Ts
MDCKKALDEVGGNFDAAVDLLRKKGIAKAAKRADKVAAEGVVMSYIHGAGKIGVLVEVNCETDFVAKNESFLQLVADIGMHIVAAAPQCISRDQVDPVVLEREKNVYREQLKNEGKPEAMIEKIMEGKLSKFYSDICLLEQAYIKDEEKTVEQLLTEKTMEIGEKVTVRRFSRFVVGEGIEKKQADYLAEVQEQLAG